MFHPSISHDHAIGLLLVAVVLLVGCRFPNGKGSLEPITGSSSLTEPVPSESLPAEMGPPPARPPISKQKGRSFLGNATQRIQHFGTATKRVVQAVSLLVLSSWLEETWERLLAEETEFDHLWQRGYGYNNPNPDRINEGLPVLNFDGKVAR